jgi:hypothetical protein
MVNVSMKSAKEVKLWDKRKTFWQYVLRCQNYLTKGSDFFSLSLNEFAHTSSKCHSSTCHLTPLQAIVEIDVKTSQDDIPTDPRHSDDRWLCCAESNESIYHITISYWVSLFKRIAILDVCRSHPLLATSTCKKQSVMPQRIVNGWQNIVRVESVTRTVSSADHASDVTSHKIRVFPQRLPGREKRIFAGSRKNRKERSFKSLIVDG